VDIATRIFVMKISGDKSIPKGIKPREFARRYGLSDNSVYQGCRDGSILSVRVGNRFVILWEKWEKKAIA
jgi:hypothetical protein